ncbi:hypothetical protein [Streptomyces pristinaespiralis]|uniref:hypothetical protein n=1 Tax=Streptomyces pristinaespiralis TaxID=38300 RepID=UPI0033E82031
MTDRDIDLLLSLQQRLLERITARRHPTTPADHPFFFDLITATHLIKLSWPLGENLLASATLAGAVDAHAAPIAALTAGRGSRPNGQLVGVRTAPTDSAQCGALLLAAENLLGDLKLESLRARALPLAREAFSRDRIYTGLVLKNSGISTVLSRSTTRRVHGGQTRAGLRIISHNHRYLLEEVPPFLPRSWFDEYFLGFLRQVPSCTSTTERTLRRATPLRLAELITGTTWGECAPALGVTAANARRTLQVLGRHLNPADLWPAFEGVVDKIARDLDISKSRVNYAKRRNSLIDWRLSEESWSLLRDDLSPKLRLHNRTGSHLGTLLIWSEVTQAERSHCPIMRPPHRIDGINRLPSLAAWYLRPDLSQTSPRFILRRRIHAYSRVLAAACDSGRELVVDVEEIVREDITAVRQGAHS